MCWWGARSRNGSRLKQEFGRAASSPILFAIWIDGLAKALKKAKVKSVFNNVKFNFTFFADDLALLADSREDLQTLLDTAFKYSECWRFKWNVAKSKVMRFGPRKGKKKQVYFLGLQELEIVKIFKFLGVDLQQNLAWTSTKRRFAAKARSRLPMIYKATFEGLSVDSGEKLWQSLIRRPWSMAPRCGAAATGLRLRKFRMQLAGCSWVSTGLQQ